MTAPVNSHIAEVFQTAMAHHQAGRLPQAETLYRQVLKANPHHPDALHFLGMIALQVGQAGAAVELISKAIRIKPNSLMYLSLGNALKEQGNLEEAVENYRKALSLKPDFFEAYYNLGTTLQELGNHGAAIENFRKTLAIKPDCAEAYNNLGLVLQEQNRQDEAIENFNKALFCQPAFAEAFSNLGTAYKDQGNLDAAIACYRKALAIRPDLTGIYNNLGNILRNQGNLGAAIESFRKALAFMPEDAETHFDLGNTLFDLGNLEAAIESYRKAFALKPDHAEAYTGAGHAYTSLYKIDTAIEYYRKALALKPGLAKALGGLGNAFYAQGKLDEAIESYRKALDLQPDYADAYGSLLFMLGYHALSTPLEYLAVARGWELACVPAEERRAARTRVFSTAPLGGRRLKVGYVSGDFRQHAMSFFVEQLFTHHNQAQIELFAYTNHTQRDEVTVRLETLSEHWIMACGFSDAALCNRIAKDGIDVLVDLSGHTSHNRLGAFARRAAPVQVHYLGYFASTGLTEMDYLIGDKVLTPLELDWHFTEHIWRLPRVRASYNSKADAPSTKWQPDKSGAIWIGSFSSLGKLTPATLALWAKVLHALPQARLLLKTKELADEVNCRRILGTMNGYGILSDRIELKGSNTLNWEEHMAYYDRLDIALDPIGAHGGYTTTCDALWMSVPVIAMIGDRMASRMTASILDAIGHPEWIAYSEAEYIDKVVALANNVREREALRFAQRERMAASPLCDAQGLAKEMENAYLEMFRLWQKKQSQQPSS